MELMVPSPIIDAALAVLADGKARSADEILAEAQKRGLLDASVTRKHVYTALSEYIIRAVGSGRRPELTEDVEDRFRINRAPDDWPDIDTTGLPPLDANPQVSAEATAAVAGARKASAGSDPTEYELAICNLFDHMGFVSTHVGGTGTPDGYADALLGPLGYRVMIECKLAQGAVIAHSDAPVEASKFRDAYHGDCCILVAPAFEPGLAFVSELHAHGVSAWTTEEVISLIETGVNAADARALFTTPGMACDILGDFQWARVHDAPKRLRVLASMVMSAALEQQRMAQKVGDRSAAPLFTVDVAIALLDAQLTAHGSEHGCTREEMQTVFNWLTNPLVHRALWANESRTSIVVV
jgi:hypothetical protein